MLPWHIEDAFDVCQRKEEKKEELELPYSDY